MCNTIEEEKLKLFKLKEEYNDIPLKTAERFGIHSTRGLIESLERHIALNEFDSKVYTLHQLRSGNEVLRRVISLIEETKNKNDLKVIETRHEIVDIIGAYKEGILRDTLDAAQ